MPPDAPKTYAQLMRRGRKQVRSYYDSVRGNSAERGYGHRWRKLRAAFLAENPLCEECLKVGVYRAATEVDHIVPKRDGGTDDASNLQGLCKPCHSRKTKKGQ